MQAVLFALGELDNIRTNLEVFVPGSALPAPRILLRNSLLPLLSSKTYSGTLLLFKQESCISLLLICDNFTPAYAGNTYKIYSCMLIKKKFKILGSVRSSNCFGLSVQILNSIKCYLAVACLSNKLQGKIS